MGIKTRHWYYYTGVGNELNTGPIPELIGVKILENFRAGRKRRNYPHNSDTGAIAVDYPMEQGESLDIKYALVSDTVPTCEAVKLGIISLPDAIVSEPYNVTIPLSGSAPFSFFGEKVHPPWMAINLVGSNVIISGIPTESGIVVDVTFTITNCTDEHAVFAQSIDISENKLPVIKIITANPASVTLPVSSIAVTSSVSDPDGSITGVLWTQISGPAAATITAPTSPNTSFTGLILGTYVFRLTATDNLGDTEYGELTVNVIYPPMPTSNPGTDQTINYPNPANISGTGTGTGITYHWTASAGSFGNANIASTTFSAPTSGSYIVSLTVTDQFSRTAMNSIVITVNPTPENILPDATITSANPVTITLPTNSIAVTATATDADGTITGVLWTKTSGPATFTISSPTTANTSFTGLVLGTYVFRLTATDNSGGTSYAEVTINVIYPAAPTANSGPNQTIVYPNSANLSGSGTGSSITYLWTAPSGTFGNANLANTTYMPPSSGTFKLTLTVTDQFSRTATSKIIITVNPAPVNQLPAVAITSTNPVTITLPTSSTSVTATATDSDGTIASVLWTKQSGGAATITTPTTNNTSFTGLVQGTYVFRLTATDNQGGIGYAEVTVNVVLPAAPTASAGNNQTITYPATASLTGSGTGTGITYHWTTGSTGTFANANAASTVFTPPSAGIYTLTLTVTDSFARTATSNVIITVNGAANQLPLVNITTSKPITVTLPSNSANVTATSSDPDGSIAGVLWTKRSGPATGGISSTTTNNTTFTNLVQGTYVFRLTATDNSGATAFDEITVNVVLPAAPTASAGSPQTIVFPATASLSGSGTGTGISYHWTGGATFSNANIANPTATFAATGTYTLTLTVTDQFSRTAVSNVTITVNPAPVNQLPVVDIVNATPATITLPTNSLAVTANTSDPDGSIASRAWTKQSGPATGTITSPTTNNTSFTNLVEGVYVFRLTATDNQGGTGYDEITINVVLPAAPTSNAGPDQIITLPSTATLAGSGTGTGITYHWTGSATFSNANIAAPTATFATSGTFTLTLTITDSFARTAVDSVIITVNPQPSNILPNVNITTGNSVTLTLPTNSKAITATTGDPDGSIVSRAWTKQSGPNTFTITTPNTANTSITNLVQGTYVFRLTATDNDGGTAFDEITIDVVLPAAPTSNAGSDNTIVFPANAGLTGAGTGTGITYHWTSNNGGSFANANAASTIFTPPAAGTYILTLTVTDQFARTAIDTVRIIVQNNQPPVNTAFGAIIAEGSTSDKVTVVKDRLNLGYLRTSILLSTFNNNEPIWDLAISRGLKVLLNLNWSSTAGGTTFPTNMTLYAQKLNQVFDAGFIPEIAVIENEPFNRGYFGDSPIEDYLTELQTAVNICNARGIKVTDGACHMEFIDGVRRGGTLSSQEQKTKTMIQAYANMNLDYVNTHYGPSGQSVPAGLFKRVADYLRAQTGKPVINNEWPVKTDSLSLVNSAVSQFIEGDYVYAVAYGADANGGGAGGLPFNSGTTLTPLGIKIRDSIAAGGV